METFKDNHFISLTLWQI